MNDAAANGAGATTETAILTLIGEKLASLVKQVREEAREYPTARQDGIELSRLRQSVEDLSNALLDWADAPDGVAEMTAELTHPNPQRFQVGDFVQLKSEYLAHGNPSLFQIVEIDDGEAILGQLSSTEDGFVGAGAAVGLDDPELIAAFPEILQRYGRHIR